MTVHDFNVFVGAESGLLKGVSISSKANLAKNFVSSKKAESSRKDEEITCMCWGNEDKEILVGLRNRTVKVFDPSDKCFVNSFDCSQVTPDNGEENFGALRGVARFQEALVTAAESGLVKVWRHDSGGTSDSFNTIDTEVNASGKLKRFRQSENDGDDVFDSEEARLKHVATLKSGRTLARMRQSPADDNVVATGGRENDLQVWDMNRTDAAIFRAKNVSADFLELRVPIWSSDLCFPDKHSSALVAYSNRYGHVRLYDTRVQRRPIQKLDFPEETLTAISATSNKDQVLVGTATGQLGLFDFRQRHKGLFRKYKGCVGSIREIVTTESNENSSNKSYFAAVGLDRFLRVYTLDKKQPVKKLYLKSRLNCVLLCPGFDPEKSEQERSCETDQAGTGDFARSNDADEEELWEKMEVVGQRRTKCDGVEVGIVAKKQKVVGH